MVGRSVKLSPIDGPDEAAPPEQPLEHWTGAHVAMAVSGAVLVLAALAFLSFGASAAYIRFPFSDAHNWMAGAFKAEKTGDWIAYFWEPHVQQRIPTALITTAFDLGTRERWPSFLVATGVFWCIGLAGLGVLLLKARIARDLKVAVGTLAIVLALNIGLAEDFALPVFSVYLLVAGPALAAFALFPLSETKGLRSPFFWLSILLAALASCGNAAGLAVWPALFVVTLVQRRTGAQIGALAIVALACGVVVEAGLGAPSQSLGAGGSGAAHLWKMIVYFASFGALPWSRAVHPAAAQTVVGLIVWGAAAWALANAQFWRAAVPDR